MILKSDCRHFPGDRPCRFNKESGQMCDGCPHYATAGTRVLIIKLAALGDVLRTTVILPGIKAEFPNSTITWLTAPGALDLLKGNPLIDELWSLDPEAALRLAVREFDVVLSPDADPHAATLATAVKAPEKRGMVLHPRGHVTPANPEAATWFEMGAFDQLKQANQRTYQELIYQTLKLSYARQEISLALTQAEHAWADEFLAQQSEGRDSCRPVSSAAGQVGLESPATQPGFVPQESSHGFRATTDEYGGIGGGSESVDHPPGGRGAAQGSLASALQTGGRSPAVPLVGLNLGGGGRWKKKQWKAHHFATFGRMLIEQAGARLLLIGGRQEAGLLAELQAQLPAGVLSSGPDRSLRETAALVGQCAVIVTGDSLALHIASALRVPTVVLLGPTSAAELEMYDRGERIVAPIGCVNCYLTDCAVDPDCMQLITPETVLAAVQRWLK
jgi:ADP-heptose:LPS heptosyltransferase